MADIVRLIERHNLKYVDKRSVGGAFWVIGGTEISPIMRQVRDAGFPFTLKIGGGRSSSYRDAWWYKPSEMVSERKSEEEGLLTKREPKGISKLVQSVDFTQPGLCARTKPLTCVIKGELVVPTKQNWSQLLVAITERLIAEGNQNIDSLNSKPLFGRNIFFLNDKANTGACALLRNGKWIYINYTPVIIIRIIKKLIQHCEVDLNDVIITYEPKFEKSIRSVKTYAKSPNNTLALSLKLPLDPSFLDKLIVVLSKHFSNGFRLNSPIEMVRFRTFAERDLSEKITLTDQELKLYIAACGISFEGKVYAVPIEAKERIKKLVQDYFSQGAQVIFFSEFYAKNESWLFESSLVSVDMLIDILGGMFPWLSFTQTYFGYADASVSVVLEDEILRVWGDNVLLNYGQLAEKLEYIPLERIKYALGQNVDFIWNSVETFSHVSRINITDEEQDAIQGAALRECNGRGYASIPDMPISEIQGRNYELSITAIHNAIYRVCLSDKFDQRGKVVTRKGIVFDALNIMKEYCRTIETCTLDDLLSYEKELTGEVHRSIPMEAGDSVLVRIDKNIYVADRYIHFSVNEIDEAIGLVITRDYIPLKSFTTFGSFPDCGQIWTLFLLASYCRRFSPMFRFDTQSVNSRNVGVVIRKSCAMSYMEIMIDVVANADIPLNSSAVGNYLYESGYTGRSSTAKVNEIIAMAKVMRERKY